MSSAGNSSDGEGDDANPFAGIPMLGDMARMMASQGALNWDVARQVAHATATGGAPEVNIDPARRFELEPLVRIADMHVADITGLDTTVGGRSPSVVPVTPGRWAQSTLDAYRPIFEHLATALHNTPTADGTGESDQAEMLMAGLQKMMAPMLLGMSAGTMVGSMATSSFGQYDLPIPRAESHEIAVLVDRVDAFAADWSLRKDDVRLWLCLHELTMHTVLNVSHVRLALTDLLTSHAASFAPQPDALSQALENADPSALGGDPAKALQQIFGRPEILLGAMSTPEQQAIGHRLDALVSLLVGYTDHVLDIARARVIGNAAVGEAFRRRRLDQTSGDDFTASLLGLRLGRSQVDRGQAFVRGVIERAGESGFQRLFANPLELPTPAEVDAPGLWLARIDL